MPVLWREAHEEHEMFFNSRKRKNVLIRAIACNSFLAQVIFASKKLFPSLLRVLWHFPPQRIRKGGQRGPSPRCSSYGPQAGARVVRFFQRRLLAYGRLIITNKQWSKSHLSFTLIELLTVIAIIAILFTMVYPAIFKARQKAKNNQALATAHNIVVALKAYRNEYGKWPNQVQQTNDTTYFVNNNVIIGLLARTNIKQKVFLSVPENCLTTNAPYGSYLDPWGVPYVICMDENDDAKLSINFTNITYTNQFTEEIKDFSVSTNIWRVDAGVASFAGTTNSLTVNSWSEIQ